jgi:outer membrane murein-binding lipoprotein Lpp
MPIQIYLLLCGIILGGLLTAAYSLYKKDKIDTDMDIFDARVAKLLYDLEHQSSGGHS